LNATIDLFLGQGINKTTMEEVAEAAGASKVTVYKYFKNKNNLLSCVNASLYDSHLDELSLINNSAGDINTKITDSLDGITEFMTSGKQKLCLDLGSVNGDIQKGNEKRYTKYKSILMQLIEEGKHGKIIREDIKSDYIFYYIDMSASYFQTNKGYRDLINEDNSFRNEFLRFFIGNIFTEGYDDIL
jgi:AcrR family transcriptional regulator